MIDADSGFVFPLAGEDDDMRAPRADHSVDPDKRVEAFFCGGAMELRSALEDEWMTSSDAVDLTERK